MSDSLPKLPQKPVPPTPPTKPIPPTPPTKPIPPTPPTKPIPPLPPLPPLPPTKPTPPLSPIKPTYPTRLTQNEDNEVNCLVLAVNHIDYNSIDAAQMKSTKMQKPKTTSTPQKPKIQKSKATSTSQKPKLKKSKKASSSLIEDAKQSSKRKGGKKSFLLLVVSILISIFFASRSGLSGMLLQFSKSQSETKNYLSVATTFSPAKEETTPNSLDVFKLRVKYNEPLYSTCTLKLINQSKKEITCKLLYVKNSQHSTNVVTIPAFGNKEIKYIGGFPIFAVAVLKVEVDGLNEEHVYKLVHVSQVTKP